MAATICITFAQTPVTISIKGGSVVSAPQMYSDTEYIITAEVLDKDGKPIEAAHVSLTVSRGTLELLGESSDATDKTGIATIRASFAGGGVLNVYLEDKLAGQLTIYYKSIPGAGIGIVALYFIVLVSIMTYALYKGPIKWYREKAPS